MKIQIANPIYDVVFKYLMEDNAVAKLVISSIIGEEIIELEPKPQERTREKVKIETNESSITVYRLDFSAKIKVPSGHKLVHIEMQKASVPSDIIRFRRYLGEQYTDPSNTISTSDGVKGLQIYCLYFLGQDLGVYDTPVLKVDTTVKDAATSEIITEKSDFIESLHHKTWIIQISCLKERRRNELEQLLAVFDQSNRDKDWHILNVKEKDFPEKYRPVIRRLKRAASNLSVKRQMKVEDEFIMYLKDCVRVARDKALEESKKALEKSKKTIEESKKTIEESKKTIEESKKTIEESKKTIEESKKSLNEKEKSLAEKDKSLLEKDKTLAEKDKSLAKKDKSLAEKDKSLLEKDKSLAEKDKIIAELERKLKEQSN